MMLMPHKWAVALVMLNTGIMLALLVAHMNPFIIIIYLLRISYCASATGGH